MTTTMTKSINKKAAIAAFLAASFFAAASAKAMPASQTVAAQKANDRPAMTRFASSGEIIKAADTKNADQAAVSEGAKAFVDNMAQKALDFLSNDTLSREKKTQEFENLLQNSFDMDTIGRFSLGRYWRVSTPQQREEYLSLFRNMVIEVYSSRFGEYKGEKFETRSFRPDGEKDTIVTSYILPKSGNGPEVQVDWRVRYKNGHYKVVDVIVEGVSMSVTQRSDFSAVIQRGGGSVEVLIDHLKKQEESSNL